MVAARTGALTHMAIGWEQPGTGDQILFADWRGAVPAGLVARSISPTRRRTRRIRSFSGR